MTITRMATKTVAARLLYSAVSVVPEALSESPAKAPGAVLDQMRKSLDNNISAGIGGVRIVISSPYLSGANQRKNAIDELNMISHGVTYMKDIDASHSIPGLASLLDKLDRATHDMRIAVNSLFQLEYDWYKYGPSISLAWPQQGTWNIIDYAEQKKNDIYDLVNNLRGGCRP